MTDPTPPEVGAWRALTDRLAKGESIPRPVLLRAAADALEAGVDRERFDMFSIYHPCGTPSCAAGHLRAWSEVVLVGDAEDCVSGHNLERWDYLFDCVELTGLRLRDGPSALDDVTARLRWLADHPDATVEELAEDAPETAEEAAEMKGTC